MAKDLDDVIRQMAEHGLRPPPNVNMELAYRQYVRFQPEGDKRRKKSAWVRLFEFKAATGRVYVTGSYGNRGDTWQVQASDVDWSPAERAAVAEARREAQRLADAERAKDGESAAAKARRMWSRGTALQAGAQAHPYLERKRVEAFGLRVGFNQRLLVPLRDVQGQLHGLQYISPEGEKIFGTGTMKEGRAHLIGRLEAGVKVLAFAEGYATAASVHMATEWPVVVCFDAGNLAPVMGQYRKLYPELEFVVAADDDRHLLERLSERLQRHGIGCSPAELRESMDRDWRIPDGPDVTLLAAWKGDPVGVMRIEGALRVGENEQTLLIENAGQAKAHAAARKHGGRVVTPFFADRASLATDWNDLHASAGLEAVREQITAAMDAPPEKPRATARAPRGGKGGRAGGGAAGGSGGGAQAPRQGADGDMPLMERFVLVYGTTTVWDNQVRDLVPLQAMKAAFGKATEWWLAEPGRLMVPRENVVFDPTGGCKAPRYVNLFDRLPLDPGPSKDACPRIVAHIHNLCGENDALFHWVMCWLAYPLKHPGAKMRTALILHGRTEGTGKTKLGQIMRRIYGRYAVSVGQPELQRDFNDWLSAKLLVMAEEVVSRAERSHHQGMLQNLITNDRVQINTKNMPIREEANHANFIFFSNQQVPVLLNKSDRRYTVIRVEQQHPAEYFASIDEELDNGGAEAFYRYLLDYDVGDFNEYTRPFENRDRVHLITLGLPADQRFFQFWSMGHAGVPFCCCAGSDLYSAFKAWCRVNGERFVPNVTQFGRTVTEDLEQLGAPRKKTCRYEGFSDKVISDGNFGGDTLTTTRQGVLYFIPARLERMKPRLDDDPREPAERGDEPDVTVPAYFNQKVKLFQVQLHDLISSARRSV